MARQMSDALLERDRELAAIDDLLDEAADGRGRVLLVEGPAGIGKSRLLAEARGRAEGSMRVLAARGGEMEQQFPFGVVRQLFEAELADPGRREQLLAGAAAPALGVFEQLGGEEDAGVGSSFAALHGLFWLALNLAEERPLMLAIDDLHWADRPSLLFAAFLARRLDGVPILLAAALRGSEPGADPALMGEIAGDPGVVSVRPDPLSGQAVEALVRGRLGADPHEAFREACRDSTGGNPLLLEQLLSALSAESVQPDAAQADLVQDIGPRAVSRTVLLRLARLPKDARSVAQSVAVLGGSASLPTVAGLAGMEEWLVADSTRALARAEILNPEPPLRFIHPLVRDAVYHELPPGERELQHARAAQVLRKAGVPAEQVAAQLLHTSPRGEAWATELLTDAGRAAMHSGAPDSAAAYFQRALDEQPPSGSRPQLLLELGVAEALVNGPAATEHLRAAYQSLDDPVARGLAANLLGRTLLFAGSPEEASVLAATAAAELPDELADLRHMLEALDLMTCFFRHGFPQLVERARPYRDLPVGESQGTNLLVAIAAVQWAYTDGDARQCGDLSVAALAGGSMLAVDDSLVAICPIVTLALADRDEAVDACDALRAHAHKHGSLFTGAAYHAWFGHTLLRRGDLAEAEAMLRTADTEVESWGFSGTAEVYVTALLSEILLERGDVAGARRVLERTPYRGDGSDRWRWWLNSKLEVLLAEHRDQEVLESADEAERHYSPLENPAASRARGARGRALHRLGRSDEARELLEEELRRARRWGAPGTVARSLRHLAEVDAEREIELLEEAVAVVEESPARLELAKALAALGSAIRRAREPSRSREPLGRALELAGTCGAEGLAEHARSELHASGARPRRDALSGLDSLTPSERRIVELAAGGQRNRDIAQELFVTPKTVEVHLSNAYRKLGISSRRELPGVLSAA